MFAAITVPATGAGGATVTVPAVMATDAVSTPTVVCSLPAGANIFPVGKTPVTCMATDAAGNVTTQTTTVTVMPYQPGAAPQLTMFAPITAEAMSAAGSTVTVPAPAVNDSGATVTCVPGIGTAVYPLGTTTITCRATNAAGDAATGTPVVRVLDTTPPALILFAPITVPATSVSGALVTLPAATTSDAVSTPTVSCSVPPGPGMFPVGTTSVVCTALDGAGNATTRSSAVTVTAYLTSTFRAISAGLEVTCALTTDGTPYCWGNAGMLLGASPAPTTPQLTPRPVLTNLKFTSISVSGYFYASEQSACALTADGTAYCWGNNTSGEIGDGTTARRVQPAPVAGGHHFVSIVTRGGTSCALDTAGAGWCWGQGLNGALGNGDSSGAGQSTPVPVQTSARLVQLSLGFQGGCGLTDGQQVLCWGLNLQGQLGRGSIVPYYGYTPQPVIGLGAMASVQHGDAQVCALDTTGAAYCWGSSDYGSVGNGTTVYTPVTTPVSVLGGRKFAGLTAGLKATCGWSLGLAGADGSSACWGLNSFGQLGDGSTNNQPVPTTMAGGLSLASITESVGDSFMHACALTATGQAYCWGNNTYGQLGVGSTNSTNSPVPVTMP